MNQRHRHLEALTPLEALKSLIRGGILRLPKRFPVMAKAKYQLNPDGSISSDDADAILELQQRILEKQQNSPRVVPRRVQLAQEAPPQVELNGDALVFLRRLPVAGTKLNAEKMAPLVGANSQYGVGPKLRKLAAEAAESGVDFGDYLAVFKTDTGSTVWQVRKQYV